MAQYNLGVMYSDGAVLQDYAEAVAWFRKAADQGIAEAQHNLGVMYFKGHGVPQDYVQAYTWFTLSGKLGTAYRNAAAEKMTPAQLREAERLAREPRLSARRWAGQETVAAASAKGDDAPKANIKSVGKQKDAIGSPAFFQRFRPMSIATAERYRAAPASRSLIHRTQLAHAKVGLQ